MNNDIDTIDQLNEAFSHVTYHRNVRDFAPVPPQARRRRRTRWLIVAAAATTAAVATGGIAAARRGLPDATSYAKDSRSSAQASALSDEDVTLSEYKAGFRRFADCMERDGRPLVDVRFDQTTSLYNYAYDGVDDCYEREFYALDLTWQVDPNRPGFVESPSAHDLLTEACTTKGPVPGFPFSGDQLAELCEQLAATQSTGD